jgi:hypothetical protein
MNYKYEVVGLECAGQLDDFFSSVPNPLLYHSIKFARLLSEFLDCEYRCAIAVDEFSRIVGALPFFLKDHNEVLIANSMPFYGSHGGVVLSEQNEELFTALLGFYQDFVGRKGCVVSTLISSPFRDDAALYERCLKVSPSDQRVGQITKLPLEAGEVALMESLPSKTRNMVRKAERQNFHWTSEFNEHALGFLADVHLENMREIGGIAKPKRFFDLVSSIFQYGVDYRVYVAYFEGRPVSAMLLFYSGETVEYFTPVTRAEYRSFQPLTSLIFHAMLEAVDSGYRYWNWGGTWATQEGVYKFKKSWGAVDAPYNYYSIVFNDSVLGMSREQLLSNYAYFYTVPFGWLKK